jgi:hypothetical protein
MIIPPDSDEPSSWDAYRFSNASDDLMSAMTSILTVAQKYEQAAEITSFVGH